MQKNIYNLIFMFNAGVAASIVCLLIMSIHSLGWGGWALGYTK